MSIFDHLRSQRPQKDNKEVSTDRGNQTSHGDAAAARGTSEQDQELEHARRLGSAIALEGVAESIAAPLSHLVVQSQLAKEGRFRAEDLSHTCQRLVGSLAEVGILVNPEVGDRVTFDPNLHQPINDSLRDGAECVVRSPGIRLASGRVIRRAGVEML